MPTTRSFTFSFAAGSFDSALTFGLLDIFVASVTVTFSKVTGLDVPAEAFSGMQHKITTAIVSRKTIFFMAL